MLRDQFVGTWTLVSQEYRDENDQVVYPAGTESAGVIIYDAAGNMAVQIMRLDRPPFASGDILDGTDAEIRAAYQGYNAYFGTYTVDEAQRIVTHHLSGALFPNRVGQDQIRYFAFEGTRLTLKTPPILRAGANLRGTLVWQRANAPRS